jgi:hypothetical protein
MRALALLPALAVLTPGCTGSGARVQALSAADQRAGVAVAAQVRRCYRSPRLPSSGRRIVTRLLVRYTPEGVLAGAPLLLWQQGVTPETQPYEARMADAAKLAVIRRAPISLPPTRGKAKAAEFYLTFSPQLAA